MQLNYFPLSIYKKVLFLVWKGILILHRKKMECRKMG